MVFLRSFCSFRELFGHFRGSECILIIMVFLGLIWSYWSFGVILFIIGVWCYFGHFGVFRVILVIMVFTRLFWSYFNFLGYFGHFIGSLLFWSLLCFGVILFILEFLGVFIVILRVLCACWSLWCFLGLFWSHWSFGGYFGVSEIILVIF